MFVGGPEFSINRSGAVGSGMAVQTNYFDQQMSSSSKRSNVVLMASYKVTLITPDGEKSFDCPDDAYIIDQAEEEGIELPYSCRAGSCSSCVAKVVSGEVDNSDQAFLDDDQLAQGYILSCVAYPKSDVTIETDKEHDLF